MLNLAGNRTAHILGNQQCTTGAQLARNRLKVTDNDRLAAGICHVKHDGGTADRIGSCH